MYPPHFGLTQDPFSIAPDPRYLFMSGRHREALAHLLYGVAGVGGVGGVGGAGDPASGGGTGGSSSGGFVLLTGDIGTGKTTVCRAFLAQVPAACHVAYIFNPKLTVPELLQTIGEEFHLWPHAPAPGDTASGGQVSQGLSPKAAIDALNAFLLRSHAAGQHCVLVIDEAQNLSADVLEQLRLLTNLETNERKLLQIILIGQPELRTLLARPELEQLSQRVIARFHLGALSETETAQYVAHRLGVAGHTGPLPFDKAALARIHRLSGGVPRRINLLCGRAMLGAWTLGQHTIGTTVVNQAAQEVFGAAPGPHGAQPFGRWPVAWAAVASVVVLGVAALGALVLSARGAPGAANTLATQGHGGADAQLATQAAATTDLATLWPQLPTDAEAAWQTLAAQWGEPAAAKTTETTAMNTCQTLAAQGLVCHRTPDLTLPLLRQLDRPAILTLSDGSGPARQAVLVGLGEHHATLQLGGQRHTVRLVQLVQHWRGDFATLWAPPPGFGDRLPDGSTGPAVAELAQRLAQLDGEDMPDAVLDAALIARVRAFQRTHGLAADGRPGPMTFMQLERATGSSAPRLGTTTAASTSATATASH